jgi:hypothetical protein
MRRHGLNRALPASTNHRQPQEAFRRDVEDRAVYMDDRALRWRFPPRYSNRVTLFGAERLSVQTYYGS